MILKKVLSDHEIQGLSCGSRTNWWIRFLRLKNACTCWNFFGCYRSFDFLYFVSIVTLIMLFIVKLWIFVFTLICSFWILVIVLLFPFPPSFYFHILYIPIYSLLAHRHGTKNTLPNLNQFSLLNRAEISHINSNPFTMYFRRKSKKLLK